MEFIKKVAFLLGFATAGLSTETVQQTERSYALYTIQFQSPYSKHWENSADRSKRSYRSASDKAAAYSSYNGMVYRVVPVN